MDTATPLTMVLAETTGAETVRYWHALDTLAQSDGTSVEYFAYDGLGSVRQLVGESGSVGLTQTFDPYGSGYATSGSVSSRLGWTGKQIDDNGFVYLRARYYAPGMGRFTQMDPSRMESNAYQYGFGNSVMFTDPSGFSPLSHCLGVYAGVLVSSGSKNMAMIALGSCADRTPEMAASCFEHSVDPSEGPLGTIDDAALFEALESELPIAAHFMYASLGRADGAFKRFDLLGKPRYMNLYRFLQEEPIVFEHIKENFVKCVIDADSACFDAGIENSGLGLREAGFGKITYQNPLWRFRVGFSLPNVRYALGTFSIGAHTSFATVTRENGEIVYRAQIEAWDNYDWVNNDDPGAEGHHPFGILASEMALIYSTGFVKPYTVFGGLKITARAPDLGGCSDAIPWQIYKTSVSQIQPTGQGDSNWITIPLSRSGFSPIHNSGNTDNVLHYP